MKWQPNLYWGKHWPISSANLWVCSTTSCDPTGAGILDNQGCIAIYWYAFGLYLWQWFICCRLILTTSLIKVAPNIITFDCLNIIISLSYLLIIIVCINRQILMTCTRNKTLLCLTKCLSLWMMYEKDRYVHSPKSTKSTVISTYRFFCWKGCLQGWHIGGILPITDMPILIYKKMQKCRTLVNIMR